MNPNPIEFIVTLRKFNRMWQPMELIKEKENVYVQTFRNIKNYPTGIFVASKYADKIKLTEIKN